MEKFTISQFNGDPLTERVTVVLQGSNPNTSVSIYAPAKATTGTAKEQIKADAVAFLQAAIAAIEAA